MKRSVVGVVVVIASVFVVSLSTSTVLAQEIDYCEGNFDGDTDVDGTDASVFKSDFGRSPFSDPCPPKPQAPVAKTGQTTEYVWLDDGAYEIGIAWPNPRFTDNGDGTVTDNLTGLIWLKDANCFGLRVWIDAFVDCFQLTAGFCGLTDGSTEGAWRLPNRFELESLLDLENFGPALPSGHPFTNVVPDYYWLSTTNAYDTGLAWSVYMFNGSVYGSHKANGSYVWPVRGGQ